jgi:SNF2 family DNA or RNA helicase
VGGSAGGVPAACRSRLVAWAAPGILPRRATVRRRSDPRSPAHYEGKERTINATTQGAELRQTPASGARPGQAHDDLFAALFGRVSAGVPVDADFSALLDGAAQVWSRPGFDTLVSAGLLRFAPFEHQLQTVRTVLQRMQGRAILADEVGLGKTIEAGLVLSELRLRGLAPRALVLTPAGLVGQWQEELDRKFALPSAVPKAGAWRDVGDSPVVLASLAAARRDPLRASLTAREWDLVVIDEAHRVRGARTASGRLARDLRSRYLLLLTATPVENTLDDLFQLVSLVAPGLLGTASQFRSRHGSAGSSVASVRQLDALRARTREVMVRHRRSEVAVILPQRLAETVKVHLPGAEAALYAAVTDRIKAQAQDAGPARLMGLRSLARQAGSGPAALAPALERAGWADLAAQAAGLAAGGKERALLERVRRHVGAGEKVVVFTAFTATLASAAGLLAEAGISCVTYHGSLSRQAKDEAIEHFRTRADVLVTTEAAGEGRNLQFCHVMVNMDLPWNPMQIEQRLGRLHRIGQEHDVVLTNLVGVGTIEERILEVLESKINLFELVVGELDMILGRVEEDFDFETSVFEAFVGAEDDRHFVVRLEAIGDALVRARTDYLDIRTSTDALVGEGEPA